MDGINSIEDIDTMLDTEFNIGESQVDENQSDDASDDAAADETVVENNTDSNTTDDSDDSSNDEGTTDQNEEGGTPKANDDDSKKEYAFAKIRQENSDLKAKAKGAEANETFLKQLAANYGYNNVEDFVKAYNDARVIQEAKDKGYDPVLYKESQDNKRRIEQLEKELANRDLEAKALNVREVINKAVVDYKLGDGGRNEIFTKLEEAGYTVDSLLNSPNPEVVIKGVLSDRIAEISKQKQVEKLEDLNSLAEEKHNGATPDKSFNLDDIIAQEMKEYKANNFYS